jgi:hypothetical protein
MSWLTSLLGVVILLAFGGRPAAAWDRPVFDFKAKLPVQGGSVRLEARCTEGRVGFHCRAGTRGPSGRGFEFEGRLLLGPQPPAPLEPLITTQNIPRWF